KNRPKGTSCFELVGRVGIRKPLITASCFYSDASGVEHTNSGPQNSANKSSGRDESTFTLFQITGRVYVGERLKKEAFAP
ncbi:hypothetical protein TNCV_1280501, partial [Trichonephila clavipes]